MTAGLLEFLAASTLVILLPGPDTLNVLRALLRRGTKQARRTALGTLTGLSVWAICAVLGVSALLRASHDGYTALRILGAAYLCVLGVQTFRSRGSSSEIDLLASPGRGLLGTGYAGGVLTNLLNPKVGVFFIAFLPAFIPHGEPVGPVTLLFGALFVAETGLYFLIFLRLADRILAGLRRPRLRRSLDRGTGAVLFGFGIRLAIES